MKSFFLALLVLLIASPSFARPCPPGSFCTNQCASQEEACHQNCAHILHICPICNIDWAEQCDNDCDHVAIYCNAGCQSNCGPMQISNPQPDFLLPEQACSI